MSLATPCRPWPGRPSSYQPAALDALRDQLPPATLWLHVAPRCGTPLCVTAEHLTARTVRKIAYPDAVCVYCGMPAGTRDHLLPVTSTGPARRQYVAVVPACGECNSGLSDRVGHRVRARRDEAHRLIRKRYARYLKMPDRWPPDELAQLGPNLRSRVEAGLQRAEWAAARLAWPDDPGYDLRAFERSGITDPIGADLL